MSIRWGPGPVFVFDWVKTSRRWQFYAGRSLFVAGLLVALLLAWWSRADNHPGSNLQILASIGEDFFFSIIGTQLVLVLLLAPAVAASSICQDKSSGTLLQLLTTDLSNAEFVLGKMASRLATVVTLIACGLPVLFLTTLIGGVDPEALVGAFVVTLGIALIGSALAVVLSVWCNKTYEVLITAYLILLLWLLIYPIGRMTTSAPPLWLELSNPIWLAFAPYSFPGVTTLKDDWMFLAGATALATLFLLPAVARVRAVAVRQTSSVARAPEIFFQLRRRWRARRWLPSPTLERNPILWREGHRRNLSGWSRGVWYLYIFLATVSTAWVAYAYLSDWYFFSIRHLGPYVNAFQVGIGLLFVSIASVTALGEERQSGSLDLLLVTPLRAFTILWGKWWGSYRLVLWLAVLPSLITAVQAYRKDSWWGVFLMIGLILSYGAAVTSLGLCLSLWIRRPGRALAAACTLYVMVSIGMIFLGLLLPGGPRHYIRTVMLASPGYGAGACTAVLEHHGFRGHQVVAPELGLWMLAYASLAGGLLLAAWATFDRSTGRNAGSNGPHRLSAYSTAALPSRNALS